MAVCMLLVIVAYPAKLFSSMSRTDKGIPVASTLATEVAAGSLPIDAT